MTIVISVLFEFYTVEVINESREGELPSYRSVSLCRFDVSWFSQTSQASLDQGHDQLCNSAQSRLMINKDLVRPHLSNEGSYFCLEIIGLNN